MRFLSIAAAMLAIAQAAHAEPALSAYGTLPTVDRVDIAPDGGHFAYVLRGEDTEGLFVFDIAKQQVSGGARIERGKVRRVSFAGPDHVILQASVTTSRNHIRGKYEFSSSASYNIKTKKLVTLLRNAPDIADAQTGAGRIIGFYKGYNEVFMPAYTSRGWYEVYRVDLDSGREAEHLKGGAGVWDWFVDSDGSVIAREDFTRERELYSIRTIRNGEWKSVYERTADEPPFSLVGAKPDRSALVAYFDPEEEGYSSLFELSFDGRTSDPIFSRSDAEIDGVYTDIDRIVLGVQYSGLYPTYEFYDSRLTDLVSAVQAKFPASSVILQGWTDEFDKLLFLVAGSRRAPAYYMFDTANGALLKIANAYDGIEDADVGEILTIQYKASDGLKIPAILTLPPSVSEMKNLPLIVLPHGGPESYDSVGFDWLAQYFANRGYLVFQPNFRGSGGFGADFRNAGHGEWGGKMQSDITDGVNLLLRQGWVDANRICIIGGSYGGYAALAGGAFTPDLYQCVAAIAPVSDVKAMLQDVKRDSGSSSLRFDYWEDLIGDLRDDSARLEAISPAKHADNFKAPVLLIHGKDDTVVPLWQSTQMKGALEAAGRPVRYVVLKGEDHWLSQSETRLQTLQELDKFVKETIGSAN